MIWWTISGKKNPQYEYCNHSHGCAIAFDYKVEFESCLISSESTRKMHGIDDCKHQLKKIQVIENMYQWRIGIRSLTN